MWIPDGNVNREDLIATCGDYLRLWSVSDEGGIKMISLLNSQKETAYCAPLTSFDWNEHDLSLIGTCSVDTTITIWNIETGTAQTQLIAHDQPVNDLSFAPSPDVFASAGADGSIRIFDLRALDRSTVLHEAPDGAALMRVAWNKLDQNYLAASLVDRAQAVVLDIRAAATPVSLLNGHSDSVNALAWAPHSPSHLLTVGEDARANIWDIWEPVPPSAASPASSGRPAPPVRQPPLTYRAQAAINNAAWGAADPEWLALATGKTLSVLLV
jgi:WD repeat-containing protein 68